MAQILVFGLTLLLYGCGNKTDTNITSAKQDSTITVSSLHLMNIPQTLSAYGQIIAPDSVNIRAQTSGILNDRLFRFGQVVKRGDVLFNINSSDLSNTLATLEAELVTADQDYQRKRRLSQLYKGGISELALIEAKQKYAQAEANYDKANSLQSIKAPIDGTITDTPFAIGDYIEEGTIIAKISNLGKLQLSYQLPAKYQNLLQLGQKVHFKSDGHNETATVSYISPQADDDANLIDIRADLKTTKNYHHTPINTFGKVTQIIDPNRQVIAIDQNFIKSDDHGFYVFIDKDSKADKRYISVSSIDKNGLAIIKSGIEPGALLITSNIDRLHNGQHIKVVNA